MLDRDKVSELGICMVGIDYGRSGSSERCSRAILTGTEAKAEAGASACLS